MKGESLVFERSTMTGVGMSAITSTGGRVGTEGVGDRTLGATKVGTMGAGVTAAVPKLLSPVLPGIMIEPRVSSVGIPIFANFSARSGAGDPAGICGATGDSIAGVASVGGVSSGNPGGGAGVATGSSCA